MFTPWLRLDARHLTHAAHLPNQKDGGHHFARHLTHAAHLLNRRMVNCDSLSKYYLRPMGLATPHMQPTSSTRKMVNCQVQPSVEMDGQVKSWSVSSLCGRQHHHVPCQVGQSLFCLVWKQIGLWLFLHDPIDPNKVDFCSMKNSCVLQWIILNSSFFCRKWSEFYMEGFYWKLNHFNLEENSY